MSKYNVGLKTLLQGLSESEFYGDLVHKFRKIIEEASATRDLSPLLEKKSGDRPFVI